MRAFGLAFAALALSGCLTSCVSEPHSTAARWSGTITITLPAHLSSVPASSDPCTGRPGSAWSDVRTGAPVAMRNGAGHVLATWTLPRGVAAPSDKGLPSGCRYTIKQSNGVVGGFDRYTLRIASHVVAVPADHLAGNLFITLPNRQYTRLIKSSGSD